MAKKLPTSLPRFALTPPEAAASLGVCEDVFNRSVRPDLDVIRLGRKVLIPCEELERWVRENAETVLR